jgi:hypothetical protein
LQLQHAQQQPWQLLKLEEAQQQQQLAWRKQQLQLQRARQLGQVLAAGQQQRQWRAQSHL